MAALWLGLAFALWGGLHSGLASLAWKAWLKKQLGDRRIARYYRLVYNLFAIVSFLPLLWLVATLPDRLLYRLAWPWVGVALLLQAGGLLLIAAATRQTDAWAFVGLRQLWQGTEPAETLTTAGPYRWVRHPIYTGTLLLLWAMPVQTRNQLIFNALATVYIVVGAWYEERKLLQLFGEPYRRYRSQTPMLLPRFWRK